MIINYDDNISLSMVPPGTRGAPGRQTEGTFMSMISARIERLPFSRFHTHLLLMGGLGYAFDAMDAAVLAFILPVLRTAWNLSSVQIGARKQHLYRLPVRRPV